MRLIVPALLLLAAPASAKAPDLSHIGPAPETSAGIAMIEDAVKADLVDPDSAKFDWPNGFRAGWYQIPFGKRYVGWITCGTVNARNRMGGYNGSVAVIGVVAGGSIVTTHIDTPNIYGHGEGLVSEACAKIGVPVL